MLPGDDDASAKYVLIPARAGNNGFKSFPVTADRTSVSFDDVLVNPTLPVTVAVRESAAATVKLVLNVAAAAMTMVAVDAVGVAEILATALLEMLHVSALDDAPAGVTVAVSAKVMLLVDVMNAAVTAAEIPVTATFDAMSVASVVPLMLPSPEQLS